MSNRLGNPDLKYMGTNAFQPPNWSFETRAPTIYDVNYSLGDLWLYTNVALDTQAVYVLVSKKGNSTSKGQLSKWVQISAGSTGLLSITGNAGGAVYTDSADNINVVGDGTSIIATGNPASHTITLSAVATGTTIFHTDSGDANEALNAISVVGAPGSGITTSGAGSTITIEGNGVASSFVDNILGVANPALGVLNIVGTGGCVTHAAGNTITITAGAPYVPLTIVTESGNAVENAYEFNIIGYTNPSLGSKNIVTRATAPNTIELDLNSDVVIDASLRVGDLDEGILVSDVLGNVSSYNLGIPGRALITGTGVPEFGPLTSLDGSILITPGDHTIDFKVVSSVAAGGAFNAFQTHDVDQCFYGTAQDTYLFGSQDALTVNFDDLTAFYPGNGVGAPATYTAVITAKYYFQIDIGVTAQLGNIGSAPIALNIITPTRTYSDQMIYNGTGVSTTVTRSHSCVADLTAGDVVTFSVYSIGTGATPNGNVKANYTRLSGFIIGGSSGSGATDFITDAGTSIAVGSAIAIQGGQNLHTKSDPLGSQYVIVETDDNIIIPPAGTLTIEDFGEGVVQSNSTGLLSSSKGTDGQLLIASGTQAPGWANLTAGAGINLYNGDRSIMIEATGGVGAGAFKSRQHSDAVRIWDNSVRDPYYFGSFQKMDIGVNLPAAWYPGDGLGHGKNHAAFYTCPSTGYYYFYINYNFEGFGSYTSSIIGHSKFYIVDIVDDKLFSCPNIGSDWTVLCSTMLYCDSGDTLFFVTEPGDVGAIGTSYVNMQKYSYIGIFFLG